MMVAGASPAQPVGIDVGPQPLTPVQEEFWRTFGTPPKRVSNYPGEPLSRSYQVDPDVPPEAFHDYIRRQHPDMMGDFYRGEEASGASFLDTIRKRAELYTPFLADGEDPRMVALRKRLFMIEMQKKLMGRAPGEFDI
jgi:hypothetical protein